MPIMRLTSPDFSAVLRAGLPLVAPVRRAEVMPNFERSERKDS